MTWLWHWLFPKAEEAERSPGDTPANLPTDEDLEWARQRAEMVQRRYQEMKEEYEAEEWMRRQAR